MYAQKSQTYYHELYTRDKALIDRVDNYNIEVTYYIDKRTSVKAILDIEGKKLHVGQVVILCRH